MYTGLNSFIILLPQLLPTLYDIIREDIRASRKEKEINLSLQMTRVSQEKTSDCATHTRNC